MYAARRIYVKQWDHQSIQERYSVQLTRGGKPVQGIKSEDISYIDEEVMYWRKANHIHQWFVDNVQDGEDDCGSYDVSPEHMRQLLDLCNQVLEASELVSGSVYTGTVYNKDNPNGIAQRETGKVIKDSTVAQELLPRQAGFFFGGEEYDEWYLEDVTQTRDWLVRMIADHEAGVPGHIIYHSSW